MITVLIIWDLITLLKGDTEFLFSVSQIYIVIVLKAIKVHFVHVIQNHSVAA